MIRYNKHTHPAAEDTQGVDGVEGLGTAGDFGDGEGAALGGPDGSNGEGDPVDLVFEDCCLGSISYVEHLVLEMLKLGETYQVSVLLW